MAALPVDIPINLPPAEAAVPAPSAVANTATADAGSFRDHLQKANAPVEAKSENPRVPLQNDKPIEFTPAETTTDADPLLANCQIVVSPVMDVELVDNSTDVVTDVILPEIVSEEPTNSDETPTKPTTGLELIDALVLASTVVPIVTTTAPVSEVVTEDSAPVIVAITSLESTDEQSVPPESTRPAISPLHSATPAIARPDYQAEPPHAKQPAKGNPAIEKLQTEGPSLTGESGVARLPDRKAHV